jgi:hypothetical protein
MYSRPDVSYRCYVDGKTLNFVIHVVWCASLWLVTMISGWCMTSMSFSYISNLHSVSSNGAWFLVAKSNLYYRVPSVLHWIGLCEIAAEVCQFFSWLVGIKASPMILLFAIKKCLGWIVKTRNLVRDESFFYLSYDSQFLHVVGR